MEEYVVYLTPKFVIRTKMFRTQDAFISRWSESQALLNSSGDLKDCVCKILVRISDDIIGISE